jgi:hypothetical protein
MTEDRKNAPLESFRDGAVTIKLWEQQAEGKSYVNASIGKLYKDQQGAWHETRSFNDTDLLKLHALIPQAHQQMKHHQEQLRGVVQEQQIAEPAPEQQPDMAAQRDAVMSKAQKSKKDTTQEHARTPSKQPSR